MEYCESFTILMFFLLFNFLCMLSLSLFSLHLFSFILFHFVHSLCICMSTCLPFSFFYSSSLFSLSFIFSRPHIKEGKEKSKYRICWEWFHRIWGAFIIVLGLIQVTLGVFLVVPPLGVWVVWILMLVGWVIAFIVHETVKWIRVCVKPSDGRSQKEKGGMEMKARHP